MQWFIYTGFSVFAQWFWITRGASVVHQIDPEWEVPASERLWPYVLELIGLVDENGFANYFNGNTAIDF